CVKTVPPGVPGAEARGFTGLAEHPPNTLIARAAAHITSVCFFIVIPLAYARNVDLPREQTDQDSSTYIRDHDCCAVTAVRYTLTSALASGPSRRTGYARRLVSIESLQVTIATSSLSRRERTEQGDRKGLLHPRVRSAGSSWRARYPPRRSR